MILNQKVCAVSSGQESPPDKESGDMDGAWHCCLMLTGQVKGLQWLVLPNPCWQSETACCSFQAGVYPAVNFCQAQDMNPYHFQSQESSQVRIDAFSYL